MEAFRYAIDDCGLVELGCNSNLFTWDSDRTRVNNIKQRLDRFLATSEWKDLCSDVTISHLVRISSDHCPIFLNTDGSKRKEGKRKIFQFEAMFLNHQDCCEVMKDSSCASSLANWNYETFGNIYKQKRSLSKQLEHFQTLPNIDRVAARTRAANSELNEILKTEEIMWRQRSRAVNHFCSTSPPVCARTLSALYTAVTALDVDLLSAPFVAEKVLYALKQMHPNKPPSSDGMSAMFFFIKFWNVVGRDVTDLVLKFLESGIMPPNLNHTFITLIPKIKAPETMKNLHTISLCNVVYKLISKVLANRMTKVLPNLIHESQSAFIPGRLTTDNAIIAFEVFHSMKDRIKSKKGVAALKLDMSKVYDEVKEFIQPSRGIRQSDPVSPYLFILCTEGLPALISPSVSHLLFADDCILFSRATMEECQVIRDIMRVLKEESRQQVNLSKLKISFSSKVPTERRIGIKNLLQIKEVGHLPKYLGLPTVIGKSKKFIFGSLKESIWKKLKGWKEKPLSMPGNNEYRNKVHWLSRNRLCVQKSEGGLGFRNFHSFNVALLAKKTWRLFTSSDSLCARIIKAKYHAQSGILGAGDGYSSSYLWHSLRASFDFINSGKCWRIGNGESMKVWKDRWICGDPMTKPLVVKNLPIDATVGCLIDHASQNWKWDVIEGSFLSFESENIVKMVLSYRMPADKFNERDSGASAYSSSDIWKKVWKLQIMPKVKNFLWRILKSVLPCLQVLDNGGNSVDVIYPRCSLNSESILHVLKECDRGRGVWLSSHLVLQVESSPAMNIFVWIESLMKILSKDDFAFSVILIWQLWFSRNMLVYRGEMDSVDMLVNRCQNSVLQQELT
ncbi:uncharacterized protein LOC126672356 [Mercurialis annua]|uniref:uncharacterized protein LOC126672356 n=1 Tax=Mercurialis annua TaxID=3986 RepID=UPI00215EB4A0|nr:uncharacterized protein LOC126672356 [Mercurialis annua]